VRVVAGARHEGPRGLSLGVQDREEEEGEPQDHGFQASCSHTVSLCPGGGVGCQGRVEVQRSCRSKVRAESLRKIYKAEGSARGFCTYSGSLREGFRLRSGAMRTLAWLHVGACCGRDNGLLQSWGIFESLRWAAFELATGSGRGSAAEPTASRW